MDQESIVPLDDGTRRDVAVVIYIPNADKTKSAAIPGRWQLHVVRQIGPGFFEFVGGMALIINRGDENLALLGIGGELPGPHDSGFGPGDYCSRSDVTLIGAAKDKESRLSAGHAGRAGRNQAIVYGVDGDPDDEQEAGARTLNDALGRDVAIGIAIENEDAAPAGIADDNFVVLLIHRNGMGPDHLRIRALDDANGSFGAIGAAAEDQYGVGEGNGDHYFIMRGIVSDAMHRAAQARGLTGNDPDRI